MRKLLLLLLFVTSSYSQVVNHTVRIIPDSTRANVGQLQFLDKQSTPHKIILKAPGTVAADVTWQLPGADVAGPLCSDGAGVLTFASGCTIGSIAAPLTLTNTVLNLPTLKLVDAAGTTTSYALLATDNTGSPFFKIYGGTDSGAPGTVVTHDIVPFDDATWKLGNTTHRWINIYTDGIDIVGNGVVESGGTFGFHSGSIVGFNSGSTFNLGTDILFNSDNTNNIGTSGSKPATIYTHNLNVSGTCTGCYPSDIVRYGVGGTFTTIQQFSSNIWMNANMLFVGTDGAFNIGSASNSPGEIYTHALDIRGNGFVESGGTFAFLSGSIVGFNSGSTFNLGTDILFNSDNTNNIGSVSSSPAKIWTHNLNVSGTCTGCTTIPADMMTTDTAQTVTDLKTIQASVSHPGLIIQGAASGTENLLQLENSTGTVVGNIDSNFQANFLSIFSNTYVDSTDGYKVGGTVIVDSTRAATFIDVTVLAATLSGNKFWLIDAAGTTTGDGIALWTNGNVPYFEVKGGTDATQPGKIVSTGGMKIQNGGNQVNIGVDYINALYNGTAGATMFALAQSGNNALLRLSNGSGSGGLDGNGAQIFMQASNGSIQLLHSAVSGPTLVMNNNDATSGNTGITFNKSGTSWYTIGTDGPGNGTHELLIYDYAFGKTRIDIDVSGNLTLQGRAGVYSGNTFSGQLQATQNSLTTTIGASATGTAFQIQASSFTGNQVNAGVDFVNSLKNGTSGLTMWALGQSGNAGLLRLSNGSGSGGFDGNGAQLYCYGLTGVCDGVSFAAIQSSVQTNIGTSSASTGLNIQASSLTGDKLSAGPGFVNVLHNGTAGATTFALFSISGVGGMRISNGTGSGGLDGNGAYVYADGSQLHVSTLNMTGGNIFAPSGAGVLTGVVSVRNAANTASCSLTFSGGLLTGSTC
jgi:hypothetical protein